MQQTNQQFSVSILRWWWQMQETNQQFSVFILRRWWQMQEINQEFSVSILNISEKTHNAVLEAELFKGLNWCSLCGM